MEIRVVFTLFTAVLLTDIALRLEVSEISGNVGHIHSIPQIAEAFRFKSGSNSILFVGNSLTNNGVSLSLFRDGMANLGANVSIVQKVVPDGSTIWSWQCILKNQFLASRSTPDLIVLGFAWNQLSDQSRLQTSSLGAFHCSIADMLSNPASAQITPEIIGEFLAAKGLRVFAQRESIRNRLLSELVPSYQAMTSDLNRSRFPEAVGTSNIPQTYELLTLLHSSISQAQTKVVYVALPVRGSPYALDEDLLTTLGKLDAIFLDYRSLAGTLENNFLDEMHLNPEGAKVVTEELVTDLLPLLRSHN